VNHTQTNAQTLYPTDVTQDHDKSQEIQYKTNHQSTKDQVVLVIHVLHNPTVINDTNAFLQMFHQNPIHESLYDEMMNAQQEYA
jgi:hypothetical protein